MEYLGNPQKAQIYYCEKCGVNKKNCPSYKKEPIEKVLKVFYK